MKTFKLTFEDGKYIMLDAPNIIGAINNLSGKNIDVSLITKVEEL